MPHSHRTPLGEALILRALVTPEQLHEGLERQRLTGEKLGEALVCLQHVTRCDLWMALGAPWIALEFVGIDPRCVGIFSRGQLRKWQAVPVEFVDDGTLVMAMSDPLNIVYTDEMWRASKMTIRACAAAPAEIAKLLTRLDRPGRMTSADLRPVRVVAERAVSAEPTEATLCEFCGDGVERSRGGVLSSDRLSSAWCLAVDLESVSTLSRHSIMADWVAKVDGGLRICDTCQEKHADAEKHACRACGRPTHVARGAVLIEVGQAKLESVRDEMQLRRRRCIGCGGEYCLACALRHGSASGADSPLCPKCNEPAESPMINR